LRERSGGGVPSVLSGFLQRMNGISIFVERL
jgi:hypothetical protein